MTNLISQNFAAVEAVFENNGFTPEQSQGITAGLAAESQLDPTIQETLANGLPGPGSGLAQFTSPSQQAAFAAIGGSSASVTQQAQLVADELLGNNSTNPETRAGAAIGQQTTASGALQSFVTMFERPGNSAGDISRGNAALAANPNVTSGGVPGGDFVGINQDNTDAQFLSAANQGVGADTPDLTDADFAGLTDADIVGGSSALPSDPATLVSSGNLSSILGGSGATSAAGAVAGAGGTPVNITDLPGADTAISGAGKAVQSGATTVGGNIVSSAANIASTAASAISSLETYTSKAFVMIALVVLGVIFVAFGLGLFGKRQIEAIA